MRPSPLKAIPIAALLSLASVVGCGDTAYGPGSGDGRYVIVNGVTCCPISENPGCCAELGGAPSARGTCSGVCDLTPTWTRSVDDQGCPVLIPVMGAGTCGPSDEPDGGQLPPPPPPPDRCDNADTTWDVAPEQVHGICAEGAPDCTICVQEVDAQGNALTYYVLDQGGCGCGEPTVRAVECCPISSTPSCDCTELGGSPDASGSCGGCLYDQPPPGYAMTTDQNGCPKWDLVATSDSCFPPGWGVTCSGSGTFDVGSRDDAGALCTDPTTCHVCPQSVDADGKVCSWAVYDMACDTCPDPVPSKTACPPAP